MDIEGNLLCRPEGWSAKHAALPADAPIIPQGSTDEALSPIARGQPCPFQTYNVYGDCFRMPDDSANPFSCHSCESNVCGVGSDGEALCRSDWWCPGDEEGLAPPPAPLDMNGKIDLEGDCPYQTENRNEDCYLSEERNPFMCDVCGSGICGVDHYGDAKCRPLGWKQKGLVVGESCPLNADGCSSPTKEELFRHAGLFECNQCDTGYCGVDHFNDATCVEPSWRVTELEDGELCPFESEGCLLKDPSGWPCDACASNLCAVEVNGDARCKATANGSGAQGPKTPSETSSGLVALGQLCDLDESAENSGCFYDGRQNPFTCLTCASGVCGVNAAEDAVCVEPGWTGTAEPFVAVPGEGKIKSNVPAKVPLGRLCSLDESGKESGCSFDGSGNPFTCLTCETGVCGVDSDGDGVCVGVDWKPNESTGKPIAGTVPLGRFCDLDESSSNSGCYYDGTENPFTCLTCSTGVCGVDSDHDALCVDVGWQPVEKHETYDHKVPLGQFCDIVESSKDSGCYFDGTKNPFTCLTCGSGVCGVDSDGDGVCVDVGWTREKDTEKPDLVWTPGEGQKKPVAGNIPIGELCDLDESSRDSGCYYDGSKKFTCLTCGSGVCGVDDDGDGVCVPVGWVPGEPVTKLAKPKVSNGQTCPVNQEDPSSGCYFAGGRQNNPFLCLGCESGVCGIDHYGDALCREVGWTFDNLEDGELCPFQKEGCISPPTGPNPWHCLSCKSGFCGEDENGDAKCVQEGWSRKKLQVGDYCPFKRDGCILSGDGSEPWSCDQCESGWCNTNSYGDARCYEHSADTPPDELLDLPDGDFCPHHEEGCHVSNDTPNPWPCKFCQSGFCGEDGNGNAQCRSNLWTPPKLGFGERCPTKQKACFAPENGSGPWFCDACESGWCGTTIHGHEPTCMLHSDELDDTKLTDLADGESCPYSEDDCHYSHETDGASWACKFCKSGICGVDSLGNPECQSTDWVFPGLKDGVSCPIKKEGCGHDESSSPLMVWSCDVCQSGSCGADSFGSEKCVKHGAYQPDLIELDEGDYCPYHQESCHTMEDSPNVWSCKFCRSNVCGEDIKGDAKCRSKSWLPPTPKQSEDPALLGDDAFLTEPEKYLAVGELCPFESEGCMFPAEGPNPWDCSFCASGFCGEDHYGDAKCVENEWEKVDLEVGERCPLNLIDQDSGCYYDKDEIGRKFLCEACATNMCGVDSAGKALCRESGWQPPKVRGRARLSSGI
uniref:Uncharacterized protein n=1 Tax=Odontella aurita TaxID=265563 RepID=A0A7S4MGF4_9STRA